ncbi:DUF1559 domain-containing protein [Tautonia sociabilis]|nr:DUF1559 domain-containing protein [Tautonia sociabilis]
MCLGLDSIRIRTAPAAIAVGMAAVQSAREAARRAECSNNLKRIGLAMLEHHDRHGRFPAAVLGAGGEPVLSWRVAVLPLLGLDDLSNRFHRDEPWDSPHNAALIAEMPDVYRCPSDSGAEPGQTGYRIAEGPGASFPGPEGIRMVEIRDGTSNTIAVFESDEHAPWTRPGGLPFPVEPDDPPLPLGSLHRGGVHVRFCDGAVRFLSESIKPAVLRALFTPKGGEVVKAGEF